MSTPNRSFFNQVENTKQPGTAFNDLANIVDRLYGSLAIDFVVDAALELTQAQADYQVIVLTDTGPVLTGPADVVLTASFPMKFVVNNTTQDLTLKKTGQVGFVLAASSSALVVCGEDDVVQVSTGGAFSGDAVDVVYDNATSGLIATDVQAAIDEVFAAVGSGDAVDVVYDNATSGLIATDVQAAIDELAASVAAGGGGDFELVDEVVVAGSAVTDIDFSGLDLSANRFYTVKAFVIPGVSGGHVISAYYNGDTTDANYNAQFFYGLNGTVGASNSSTANVHFNNAMPDTTNSYSFDINLSQSSGAKPCAEARGVGLHTTGAPFTVAYAQRRNNTANVTSLKLRNSITNGFGIGTVVRLYRLKTAGGGSNGTIGKHAIPVMASGMSPKQAAGCASLAYLAGASGQPDVAYLAFDPSTEEHAQFAIPMPKSWDAGTITFEPIWMHPATTTNFGVCFKLRALAVSNDDTVVASFGTAQSSVDTGGTTSDLYTGPESSAITIAGTPAKLDTLLIDFYRDPADGGDTLAVDAYLVGIRLFITTDAETDA